MTAALILLGLGRALAQEPAGEPAPAPEEEVAPEAAPAPRPDPVALSGEEMVVWGERVGQARSRLDLGLRSYGYKVKRKRDGVTVYGRTGRDRWKPKVLVSADGIVTFRNPTVVFYPPLMRATPPTALTTSEPSLAAPGSGYEDRGVLSLAVPFQVPSKKIQKQEQGRVIDAIGGDIRNLQAALAGEGEAQLLSSFPDKLDRLWEQGVDPRGGPILPDAASRKAALIELYRTRADTPAGHAVRAMIVDFLSEVVMSSPTPLNEQERALAEDAGITLD